MGWFEFAEGDSVTPILWAVLIALVMYVLWGCACDGLDDEDGFIGGREGARGRRGARRARRKVRREDRKRRRTQRQRDWARKHGWYN